MGFTITAHKVYQRSSPPPLRPLSTFQLRNHTCKFFLGSQVQRLSKATWSLQPHDCQHRGHQHLRPVPDCSLHRLPEALASACCLWSHKSQTKSPNGRTRVKFTKERRSANSSRTPRKDWTLKSISKVPPVLRQQRAALSPLTQRFRLELRHFLKRLTSLIARLPSQIASSVSLTLTMSLPALLSRPFPS